MITGTQFSPTLSRRYAHGLYGRVLLRSLFMKPEASKVPGHLSLREGLSLTEQVRDTQGGVVVEIGSFLGRSANFLMEGNPKHLYCIDTWQNDTMTEGKRDTFAIFQKNMARWDGRYTAIRKDSRVAGREWVEPIDLLWIDGDHSYEGCLADLENFFPHLKPGGWVGLHDYLNPCGVATAVDAYLTNRVSDDRLVGTIFYARKN